MTLRFLNCFCVLLAMCCGWPQVAAAQSETKNDSEFKIRLAAGLEPDEVADGWIALFDDHSRFGWKPESKVNWNFKNQMISASEGEVGLLRTTSQFDNFILKLEYRADAETNSGVFIRTSPKPKSPAGDCYEINIAPAENPFPTGSLVARKKTDQVAPKTGWVSMTIRAEGARITVHCAGKKVCEYQDKSPLGRGYIGLQFNSGKIAFRKIRLKPLFAGAAFNGKDLSGWKTYPQMKSKVSVADGALRIQDGPGQLETRDRFADFVFQATCLTHAKGLNSGIFFRCIPGEKMNGYESQIQNEFKGGDPNAALDCGTGGIFRRQNARRINARDQEWFVKTIVAVGPHVSVWVNGYQVSDWTDKRKDDNNPRRGRKLTEGTIMIQGHDPTTDLSFKNIRIKEIDPRRMK